MSAGGGFSSWRKSTCSTELKTLSWWVRALMLNKTWSFVNYGHYLRITDTMLTYRHLVNSKSLASEHGVFPVLCSDSLLAHHVSFQTPKWWQRKCSAGGFISWLRQWVASRWLRRLNTWNYISCKVAVLTTSVSLFSSLWKNFIPRLCPELYKLKSFRKCRI